MPRPIDADAICCGCPSYEDCKGECWSENECEIYDVLIKAPTLSYKDLVPQGEWIWDEECECWCCSRCEASALNNYRGLSVDSNFCPNCGVRMKGGETE